MTRPPRQLTTSMLLFLAVVLLGGIWWFGRNDVHATTPPEVGAQPAVVPATSNQQPPSGNPRVTRTAVASAQTSAEPVPAESTTVIVRVVDHDGEPLYGIEVRVAQPGRWGTFKDLRTARTGLDGQVAFADYPRDDVWAEVATDSLPPGHVAAGRVHGSLKSNASLRLTIECPRASILHGRFARAYGEPVAGATILLEPIDHDSRSELRTTDRDGRFRLEGAHPGSWQVRVKVDDRRRYLDMSLPEPVTIRVPPGGVAVADLTCRSAGGWILGRVVDQHNRPVAGVLVAAGTYVETYTDPRTKLAGPGRAFAATDALGTFRIGPLEPERCGVAVGERHGSSGVTRDRALFADWPAQFRATPGDGIDHVIPVTVVDDVITWRVRPQLDPAFASSAAIGMADLRAKVGWCRMFAPTDGVWTVRTERRGKPLVLLVSAGDREWRVRLDEPAGDVADIELELPPGR